MNTATPRATCAFTGCNFPEGGCAGSCQLHRIDTHSLPHRQVAMVAPQHRADMPCPTQPLDGQYEAPDLRWFAWVLISLALTFLSFVMGLLAQRFFF